MTIEVSPQHHTIIKGNDELNLKHICAETGTTVEFSVLGSSTICIRGKLCGVLKARFMLMVLLV